MVLITTSEYIDLLEIKLVALHLKTSNVGVLQRMAHILEIQKTFALINFYKNAKEVGEFKELQSPKNLHSN